MPLSEHLCWVALAFKMTEWVQQWICINFALSLNIPLQKLFRWFRRPQLWAASTGQCTCSCITPHAEFFAKTSNHPGDSVPLQPRFGALWLLAFPKTKIAFEREEISDHWWDSGKYNGATDGNWENCVRSKVPTLKGTEASLSCLCTVFLVSCIFFINISIFHITWLDTFWTDLIYIYKYTHT